MGEYEKMTKNNFNLFESTEQTPNFEVPNELPRVGEQKFGDINVNLQKENKPSIMDVSGAVKRVEIFMLETGQVTVKSLRTNEELTFDLKDGIDIGNAVVKYAELTKEEKLDSMKYFVNGGQPRNVLENNFIKKIVTDVMEKIKSGEY